MVKKKIFALVVIAYSVLALSVHLCGRSTSNIAQSSGQIPELDAKVLKQTRAAAKADAQPNSAFNFELQNQAADVSRLIKEGKSLMRANQIAQAEAIFQQAVRLAPASFAAHYNLGRAMVEEGRFSKAEEQFLTCTLISPHDNSARFAIANVYEYTGRFADAILVFKQILKAQNVDEEDRMRVDYSMRNLEYFRSLGDANSSEYVDFEDAQRWQKSVMPLRVSIWSDPELKSAREIFRQAVIRSFEQWRDASGGKISFVVVPDQRSADIVCKLVRVMRGDRFNSQGRKVGETSRECSDTKYDAVKWSRIELFWDDSSNENKLEAVLLHEAGHSLGLNHSSNPHDIMFPFTKPPYAAILSNRDRNSMAALYAKN